MPITKDELNELGFHRFINDKVHFAKPGYLLWTQEIEPGNVYNKVAVCKDNDAEKNSDYIYFYSAGALQRYLELNEPVNPNSVSKAQEMWDAPYPAPTNYNDAMFHPSEGVWGSEC